MFSFLSALSNSTRFTFRNSPNIISFARSCIIFVVPESAGPPEGGLYLNPPSFGGLCEGVIITPSDNPFILPLL